MEKENNIAPINEDLNVPLNEVEEIKQKIFCIRGKQVILDNEIAKRYEVETKQLNQAVKRNKKRFPEQFCFQLTENEYESLRSQFVTLKIHGRGQHRKYLPYAFTEQGVAMLSAVLHSDKAVNVSIQIMNAFIEMRKYLINSQLMIEKINSIEQNQLEYRIITDERLAQHDKKIENIFKEFEKSDKEELKQKIFFKGQIWDSYSLIVDLIKRAKEKILIIDNYVDDSILKMLSKKNKNVEVVILTSDRGKITKLDVQKFNKEYPTLKLSKTNKFHDRFIVIDNKEAYHCGASIKDLGNKCFAINKIEDENIIIQIIK